MKTGLKILGAILVLATLAFPAAGSVIYDNGAPDQGYIWYSDPSYYIFRVAEDFVLDEGASVITDIHWWGAYMTNNPPLADDFTITIYDTSVAAGVPGNVVYSNNVGAVAGIDTGLNGLDSFDIYAYSLFVDPISLTAGATYWLEIVNDTGGQTWGWSTSDYVGGSHAEWNEGWYTTNAEMAFNLTNDANKVVPEPASIALLGLGLAGLARRRFFKRG